MQVAYDLQPVQSVRHGERGIARYVLELGEALAAGHPEQLGAFLVDPGRPIPERMQRLDAIPMFAAGDRPPVDVFHLTSPFEFEMSLEQLWPQWARANCRLVVTLYDLIPLLFSEAYLQDPVAAARYKTRLEVVRRADRILAISEATAADAVRVLGLPPSKVTVVGAAPSPIFVPPASVDDARLEVSRLVPGVRPGYVLYTGGVDWRKNVHGLLEAYGNLPEDLRHRHQLVIVCSVDDENRIRFTENLDTLGLAADVLFTGRVTDEALVRLYQAADLFVFPSHYEGYGLPVAEALASGTPVVCSRSSSLVELVHDDDALFDADDSSAISASMRSALEDPARRERLRHPRVGLEWADVADATAAAYERVGRAPARRRPRRPKLALVSPLPPIPSGVADYTSALLQHLSQWCQVDVFVDDGELTATADIPGVPVHAVREIDRVEAIRSGFDGVLYCVGNQTSHAAALELLGHRPGAVLVHDLRLTGLYAWSAKHWTGLAPDGFQALLHELHPRPLPDELGAAGFLDYREADAFGVFMAARAIEQSSAFFTHSDEASRIARLEVGGADAGKVRTVPFAFPPVTGAADRPGPPLIATFGVADPIKQTPKVLEAFGVLGAARDDAQLAIVGPMPEVVQAEYRERAQELGVLDRVTVTGRVSNEEYRAWLDRATVALQLRASWGGEASAAVADSMAHGVVTVATATGWVAGLPDDTVVRVERDISPEELAAVAGALLDDADRRDRVREAAWRYAEANSFRRVAEALYHELGFPAFG